MAIWRHVHSWLKQTLDYPLYIGEHIPDEPSMYNLSLARNQAAQLAGDWEVAVVHDADTVINPQQIKVGVAAAMETGAVTYPYTERLELDFEGTKMLLEDESSDWQSHMTPYTRNQPLGGCIIVRRDLWELVRGFDSGFVGWGHEDGAFAIASEILSGKRLQRVPGKSLHLEHVAAPAKRADNPIYLANQARIKRYMRAMNQPKAVDMVRALRDESVGTDADDGITWPVANKDTVIDYEVAKMLLVDVTNVLDKYKCTHWLSDGTLLGALRDNNFMPQDDDIDLGVWAADFDIRAIHELAIKFNCNILRLQGRPDDGMIITLGRAGVHLDMFFYYPSKNTSKDKGNANIYCSYYLLEKPYKTSNKSKRFDFEYPAFKSLKRRTFLDHEFWVPKDAAGYLTVEYGQTWREPKTSWDPATGYHNMSANGVVEDMAAEQRMAEEYLKIRLA